MLQTLCVRHSQRTSGTRQLFTPVFYNRCLSVGNTLVDTFHGWCHYIERSTVSVRFEKMH